MPDVLIQLTATGRKGPMEYAKRLAAIRSASRYPKTAAAIERVTNDAQKTMLRAVQGKPVSWSGGTFVVQRVSGALHGAILGGRRYPFEGNPLKGALVITHAHYKFVRDGIKPFDMKPGLLARAPHYSPKVGRWRVVPIQATPFSARIFRIVSDRSKGWLHPGTLPRRIDLYTTEKIKPLAVRRLREAMRADLKGI